MTTILLSAPETFLRFRSRASSSPSLDVSSSVVSAALLGSRAGLVVFIGEAVLPVCEASALVGP